MVGRNDYEAEKETREKRLTQGNTWGQVPETTNESLVKVL